MSTISAGTTTTAALVETGDTTGNLVLQVNGTTPSLTLNAAGAHGVGASPSYGTTGQVLTSAGSAASPTWATPATGAMTLISTLTASTSANLSWTGLSGYDKYMLIISNYTPSTLNATIQIKFGYGAGPTYFTGGYNYTLLYTGSNSGSSNGVTPNTAGSISTSSIPLSYGTSSAETNPIYEYTDGVYYITGANTTSGTLPRFTIIGTSYFADTNNGGNFYSSLSGIRNNAAYTLTALQITASSGNIATATASLYGISS